MRHTKRTIVIALLSAIISGCGGAQGLSSMRAGEMPAGGDFDGVYQSDFGRLELTGSGGNVAGLYESDLHWGRIEGQTDGDLLRFRWTQWTEDMQGSLRESTGRGVYRYLIETEQIGEKIRETHRLKGSWGYDDDDSANRWDAYKLSARAKKRLEPRKAAASEMDTTDYGTSAGFSEAESATAAEEEPAAEAAGKEPAAKKPAKKEEEEKEDSPLDIF